jgi:hypothetical protein
MIPLTDLILLYLGSVGITLILVRGRIFEPLRQKLQQIAGTNRIIPFALFRDIIHCPQCCGFWVGACTAVLYLLAVQGFTLLTAPLFCFLFAGGVSFLTLSSDLILSAIFREDIKDQAGGE